MIRRATSHNRVKGPSVTGIIQLGSESGYGPWAPRSEEAEEAIYFLVQAWNSYAKKKNKKNKTL